MTEQRKVEFIHLIVKHIPTLGFGVGTFEGVHSEIFIIFSIYTH